MRRGLFLLLFFAVLLRAAPLAALEAGGPVLVLERTGQETPLGPFAEVLEDPGRGMALEDVLDPLAGGRFRPANQTWINLGLSDSAWWIRFRLAQDPALRLDPGEEWVLDLGWTRPRSVRLYLPRAGGGWSEQAAGDPGAVAAAGPVQPDNHFVLPRDLPVPAVCYLRVESASVLFLPAEVLTESAYAAKVQRRSLGQGVYYGVMLAMLGLNLLFYLSLRDKSHAWYLLYVFFLTAYFLAYNGHLLHPVFEGRSEAEAMARLLLMGAFILCAAQFARAFLFTARIAPAADRVLVLVILLTMAAMALTPTLPPRLITRYYALFAFLAPLVALWSGVLVLRRGFRPARFYVAAWVVMGLGSVVHGLIHLKLLPLAPFSGFFLQGATACEAVILALALTDRVRILSREREELALAEDLLRRALDAAPLPLVLSRLKDGVVLFANRAAGLALDLRPEELLGSGGGSYYADPARRDELFRRLRGQGRVQGFEAEMGRPGVWGRTASISATLMDYRGEEAALFAFDDITERKRAEAALRKSEERYRLLVENTNEGVGVMQDGILRYANPPLVRRSGYETGQLLGREALGFIHPADRPALADLSIRVLNGELPAADVSTRAYNRSGSQRWLEIHLVRIEWDGRPAILFFTSDVTRRVAMERDLLAAKSQAEEASRAKSAFLASMSHEIRTPLSAVIGMVDLASAGELDPARRDCLVTASDSARHLLTIVTDLLDFSKIEAGKLVLERVHFDLHEAVESAARTFSFQARQRGLELSTEIDPAAPRFVLGDPNRLRQVLVNLLGNALKFTEQGFVRVEVRPVDPGRPGKVGARVLVRDSGIGIPADKADTVFEQFTQAEGSISRRYGGTGLGLAICRRLVELMGGSIGVESAPGQGSTFFFNLVLEPGDQRLAPEPEPRDGESTAGEGRLKILLVEDNPVNVKVAALHLAHMGHEMVAAQDGVEALKLLARERFDAVLMDLEMPGMDGLEVTRRIRAGDARFGRPLDPLIPIVAMTAHALAELRDRCLEAGMDGYVVKPANYPDLIRLLLRLARGERETGRLAQAAAMPAEPGPGEDLPVLDREAARKAMDLDESAFASVLEFSLQEMDRRLRLAQAALEAGDDAALALHAHTLKGTAAGMGAPRCARRALALHNAAQAGDRAAVARELDMLGAEFQTLLVELSHT